MIDGMHRNPRPQTKSKKHHTNRWIGVVAILFLAYTLWSWLALPTQALAASNILPPTKATEPVLQLDWPGSGQAAIGTESEGLLATHGAQKSVPIASVAKIMLALSVLKQKPISAGTQGPTLTLTQHDVDIYNDFVAKDGSVALVAAGEKITEYQALQALLLPSANNMATTIAEWAFGSMDGYITFANSYAASLGLASTHLADASGFEPGTRSSATDLVTLGQLAMKNSTIREIVAQRSASIPVAGTIYNVNHLLGSNGVIGIKTGNTDQAGGCLLFATTATVGGHTFTIIGAVLGLPTLYDALHASSDLLRSAKAQFANDTYAARSSTVASYQTPWGETATIKADDTLKAISWGHGRVSTAATIGKIRLPLSKGQVVGKLAATSQTTHTRNSVPLVVAKDLHGPSLWWRLVHPVKTWQLHF